MHSTVPAHPTTLPRTLTLATQEYSHSDPPGDNGGSVQDARIVGITASTLLRWAVSPRADSVASEALDSSRGDRRDGADGAGAHELGGLDTPEGELRLVSGNAQLFAQAEEWSTYPPTSYSLGVAK